MAKHEYRILSRKTEGGLAAIVEEFLNAGWQLVGGVHIDRDVVSTGREQISDTHYQQPKFETVLTFYQAILHVTNPRPVTEIHIEDAREVMDLYSEN